MRPLPVLLLALCACSGPDAPDAARLKAAELQMAANELEAGAAEALARRNDCAAENEALRRECDELRRALREPAAHSMRLKEAANAPAKVVGRTGMRWMVSRGSRDGAREGDTLRVVRGIRVVGELRIDTVHESWSIARPADVSRVPDIEVGDDVTSASSSP